MNKTFTILLFLLYVPFSIFSDDNEGDVRLFNPTGVGVRAQALANNVTASTNDLSSLYWNPGALGFVPVREVQFSFDGMQLRSSAEYFNTITESQMPRLRLANAGLLFAMPVTQGGFSFALAYQNPVSFDDLSVYSGVYLNPSRVNVKNTYKTNGGLHFWTGGFGIQVAPNFAVGVALSLIKGSESTTYEFLQKINTSPDSVDSYGLNTSYTGFDSRLGLTYKYERITAGARFSAPQVIRYTEKYSNISDKFRGRLYSSYQGAAGVGVELPFLQVSAEGRVTFPFTYVFQSDNIPDLSQAAHYKVGGGLGVEIPIPSLPILARFGYSYDQLDLHYYAFNEDNFNREWSDAGTIVDRDKQTVSSGIAFVASSLSLDISYAASFWAITTKTWLKQDYLQHHVSASLSLRY